MVCIVLLSILAGVQYFLFLLVFRLVHAVLRDRFVDAVYWWYIIGALQFSGGIFLPEFIYPVLLVTYHFRVRIFQLAEGSPIVITNKTAFDPRVNC